jgi:endoribonuclease Dicer
MFEIHNSCQVSSGAIEIRINRQEIASTFRTALLFPSIIRRLDSFLLVKELNARFFNHQISETLLDMAITTPSTRMEYDYERLEFLGQYLSKIFPSHADLTRTELNRGFVPKISVFDLCFRQ